ncbi:MAG: DUF2304 domain-containing protein [Candidatus Omnitrophica bacterium]|jgi:hypothetical protein|nr:DUF2304 domain-containing protein [Candidatus Omnitrophota bacterium]
MQIKIFAISVSVVFLLLVIELIRREKITFKYALMWLVLSSTAIVLAAYENFLFSLAEKLGFKLPSNFIFFVIGIFVVLLSLFLTGYICQQNSRTEKLAQEIGILKEELSRLKKK